MRQVQGKQGSDPLGVRPIDKAFERVELRPEQLGLLPGDCISF